MATVIGAPVKQDEPRPRLWTKAEYYHMGELGWFNGQKAELLEGEIVVTSPQGPLHFSSLERVARVLAVLLPDPYAVRSQGPLDLGLHTEPEPDVVVVPARPDNYASAHPQTALLIVEVSDTTLASDRARKGSLYARAGIRDYWIVNLVDRRLEVYRNPRPNTAQRYGHEYADRTILTPADSVSPLCEPTVAIAVADLVP
jgi:Uma2 family endonuclease